jgi:hypothetical protein
MPEKFDSHHRYLVTPEGGGTPVAHTRATTHAATLDDRFGLEKWSQRMVALGLSRRPDLLAQVAAAPDDERTRLDSIVVDAIEAGGSSTGRNIGEALHRFTERVDAGELELSAVGEAWRADVAAYRKSMDEAGFAVELIERVCVVPQLTVAGTFDRVVSRDGQRFVLDVKTGQNLKYSWPSIAIQLALYAHAETLYDSETGKHSPMPGDVSQTLGIVAHVPAGKGRCDLIGVNLVQGWQGAQLAHRVRSFRKEGFCIGLEDMTATRRAWLVAQVRRLVDEYPDAARDLALQWPNEIPTLKQDGHNAEQLEQIAQAVQKVEAVHRVPFGDPDPLRAETKATEGSAA